MAADTEVLRRLAESLDPLPYALVVVDRSGELVWANARAYGSLGIGPDASTQPLEWREALALDRALAGERVVDHRLAVGPEELGEILSVSAIPVHGEEGAVIGAYALAHEVGEELRGEKALARVSGELSATFEMFPGLLFRLRPDGTFVDFRVGGGRSLYSIPEQFLGRRVREVLPATAADPIEVALESALRGEPSLALYALPGPEGERCFEARLTRSTDGDVIAVVREHTEKRQHERERDRLLDGLRRERAWLEAVLRQMPSGGLLVDAATRRVVLVNDQLERILGRRFDPGIDLATYVRQPWLRDGAPLPASELPILRAVDGGETVVGEEIEIIRGDGVCVRLCVNAGPVRDGAGRTLAAISVVSDVTAEHRAAQALRALVDTSLELSTLEDLDRALERAARRAVPVLADFCCIDLLEGAAFRRAAWAGCEPGLDLVAAALVAGRAPEGGEGGVGGATAGPTGRGVVVEELSDTQLGALLDAGHPRELLAGFAPRSLVSVPLRIGGAVAGAMTFAFCTSGRRYAPGDLPALAMLGERVAAAVANARLFASTAGAREDAESRAARLGALFQNMREAITILDGRGHILIRNPAMKRLTGLDNEHFESILNIPGLKLFALSGEALAPEAWPTARLAAGEELADDEEYVLERPDGTRRRILCSGVALHGSRDGSGLALFIVFDVTALRELEAQREDFIRAISHDIRQPLSVVLASAEMLQRDLASGTDAQRLASVDRILRGARRMRAMTRDLIATARLESGALALRRERRDLAALLQEIASHVGTHEEQARIVLDLAGGEAATALVDPEHFERAVVNLLTNALKYSPPDAPVKLSLRHSTREALIAVADQGSGISSEVIPRLFSRYFRAVGDGKDGLGLGLYISRLIVAAHGGRIWVESEPQRGSTFSIALPIAP